MISPILWDPIAKDVFWYGLSPFLLDYMCEPCPRSLFFNNMKKRSWIWYGLWNGYWLQGIFLICFVLLTLENFWKFRIFGEEGGSNVQWIERFLAFRKFVWVVDVGELYKHGYPSHRWCCCPWSSKDTTIGVLQWLRLQWCELPIEQTTSVVWF